MTRKIVLLLAGLPGLAAASPQSAVPCPDAAPSAHAAGPYLHVVAVGAHSVAGQVAFTLYGEDRARFLAHHGSIAPVLRAPLAAPGEAHACFALSAPGRYAVAVYHDENANGRLDRTLIGLPAEGYGFSRDAPASFGLPAFGSAALDVPKGETRITIRLRY